MSEFIPPTPDLSLHYRDLREIVSAHRGVQKLRMATANRILQIAMRAAGIAPASPGERAAERDGALTPEAQRDLARREKKGAAARDRLLGDFDAVLALCVTQKDGRQLAAHEVNRPRFARARAAAARDRDLQLDAFAAFNMCAHLRELEANEARVLASVGRCLKPLPIWRDFLAHIPGVGPTLGGAIVGMIDIHRAEYPSSLWKYAGLDVAADGTGRSRRAGHLVEVEYTDETGKRARRRGLSFNPDLKTRLHLMVDSFIKIGPERSDYARQFYEARHRYENHATYGTAAQAEYDARWKDTPRADRPPRTATAMHRKMMAYRIVEKRFLADLYNAWRPMEGLPVAPGYATAKLGMTHGSADQYKGGGETAAA